MKTPPARVLVVVTRRIGDVLLATPLIRSLKAAWPEAAIDALVFEGTEGVLVANPDISRVIAVAQRPACGEHWRLLLRLWRGYDVALSLVPGDRPTLYACVAARYRAGLALPGAKHGWKRLCLSRWAEFDETGTHTALAHLQLADLLGVPRRYEVVVKWSAQDGRNLAEKFPFAGDYAVLHIYPKFPYKMWRREAWGELAQWLAARGLRIVLTGGGDPAETAYVSALAGLMPEGTANLAGRLTLAETACLMSRARLYVGPDTSVTHIAAALGVPTVALFGPSSPVKWGPWPHGYARDENPWRMKGTQRVNNVALVQGPGECVPCLQEGCDRHPGSSSDCLLQLPVSAVVRAITALLEAEAA